ncbi:hypothetical protein ON010_g7991 [Phytophthora cinnamomi]|nr:hypothetical protein ON010_g7991 [Phytophthora cinnamomi]
MSQGLLEPSAAAHIEFASPRVQRTVNGILRQAPVGVHQHEQQVLREEPHHRRGVQLPEALQQEEPMETPGGLVPRVDAMEDVP